LGPGGNQKLREHVSALQVNLKPTITYGKGTQSDSHPIINEWGGAQVVSSQVRMVPELKNL
jgi:hypothetical protein